MKSFYVLIGVLAVIVGSVVCLRSESDDNDETDDERIIGGWDAEPGQFPFQFSLRGRRPFNGTVVWSHQCGGGILSNRWVITAAHCTQEEFANTSNLMIAAGAHHISNDGQLYQVELVINHENYTEDTLENDIAVLRTVQPIIFNERVRPIQLAGRPIGGDVFSTVSGWGVEKYGTDAPPVVPEYLRFVHMQTLTVDECRRQHTPENATRIFESTLCAIYRHGHGACYGDSGSPLTRRGQLIGLVSWGEPCAVGRPDIFTRTSTYLDWIRDYTGILPAHW